MNCTNIAIGLCLAAEIVAAVIAALMGARPQLVDGVSSPEWFNSIKPERF